MKNLKEETLSKLMANGKTPEDIKWIGCKEFKIPINLFWKLADHLYDDSYGTEEVATDLLIVGDNWWLERSSYDGAEWWSYKTMPEEPKESKVIPTLFPYLDEDEDIYYLSDYK